MKDSLSGKRIAFLATDGVEQVELSRAIMDNVASIDEAEPQRLRAAS